MGGSRLVAFLLCLSILPGSDSRKVGIVGSGIAGAASAHFIRTLGGPGYEIHVYEMGSIAGGRLRDVYLAGDRFEAGGSIIHPANFHMRNFTAFCNLTEATTPFDAPSMGMWDGKGFVFLDISSSKTFWGQIWYQVVSKVKGLWRYGFSPLKMKRMIQAFLEKFLRVYHLLEEQPFEAVQGIFTALDLYNVSQAGLDKLLLENGVSPRVINEIAAAVTRINYNQNTTMSGLSGSVALAAMGGKLWAVQGGNKQVPECLIQQSGAKLYLQTTVKSIKRRQKGGYELTTDSGEVQTYDAVIIATPLTLANLTLTPPVSAPHMEMQHTHTTFVRGLLSTEYFRVSHYASMPRTVATLETTAVPFSSIGVQKVYEEGKDYAYKVFSRVAPSEELLNQLFSWRNETIRIDWAAYPVYKAPAVMGSFRLDKYHLYYPNAMEGAISCMETEALGAENTVRLMVKDFEAADAGVLQPWEGRTQVDGSQKAGSRGQQHLRAEL